MSKLNLTFKVRQTHDNFVFAAQGKIASISMHSHQLSFHIEWMLEEILSFISCGNEGNNCLIHDFSPVSPHLPNLPNFQRLSFCRIAKGNSYHFIKYVEVMKHIIPESRLWTFQISSGFFPECKKKVHSPKMFSWKDSENLCRDINGTQLELLNRGDMEEFLTILKTSVEIFPIDVLFVGLRKHSRQKVRTNLPIPKVVFSIFIMMSFMIMDCELTELTNN